MGSMESAYQIDENQASLTQLENGQQMFDYIEPE